MRVTADIWGLARHLLQRSVGVNSWQTGHVMVEKYWEIVPYWDKDISMTRPYILSHASNQREKWNTKKVFRNLFLVSQDWRQLCYTNNTRELCIPAKQQTKQISITLSLSARLIFSPWNLFERRKVIYDLVVSVYGERKALKFRCLWSRNSVAAVF